MRIANLIAFLIGLALIAIIAHMNFMGSKRNTVEQSNQFKPTYGPSVILKDQSLNSASGYINDIAYFTSDIYNAQSAVTDIILSQYGLNHLLSAQELEALYTEINQHIALITLSKLEQVSLPTKEEVEQKIIALKSSSFLNWYEIHIAYFDIASEAEKAHDEYVATGNIPEAFMKMSSPVDNNRHKLSFHELAPNIQNLVSPMKKGSISKITPSNRGHFILIVSDSGEVDVSDQELLDNVRLGIANENYQQKLNSLFEAAFIKKQIIRIP